MRATQPPPPTATPSYHPGHTPDAVPPTEALPAYPSRGYAWYVVAVLMLAYVSSFIDRQILSLLVAPIRRDLGISDTGMSLLMGLSFAVLYTFLGLPIGRLADGRSRRGIIVTGIAVWSVMTAACGMARSFAQLFLARVGVGVGEATLSPAAYSVLTDYFPPDRLATALSVYSAGIYLGAGLAVVIGGLVLKLVAVASLWTLPVVGAVHPWQTVFFAIGLPGLAIALLALTVREPVRRGGRAGALPVRETVRYVRDNARTFGAHHVGIALVALAAYAMSAWVPAVFMRTWGWSAPRVGVTYGLSVMVCGTLGIVAGGRLADHGRRLGRADAKLHACLVGAVGLLVTSVPFVLVPNATAAALLLVPLNFFAAMPFGAGAAAVQELAPNRMRAQISALYLFIVNLLGLGTGPTAVALLTDYAFHDDHAVRASLGIVAAVSLSAASLLLAWGRPAYAATLAYRDRWLAEHGEAAA